MTSPPIRLVISDVPGHFFRRLVAIGKLRRVTLVAPWISLDSGLAVNLRTSLNHIQEQGATLLVITRPPDAYAWHRASVEEMARLPKSRVYVNPHLHAKFFIADGVDRSFAVMGSANLTLSGSSDSHEVGISIRNSSWGGELLSDLTQFGQQLRFDRDSYRWR